MKKPRIVALPESILPVDDVSGPEPEVEIVPARPKLVAICPTVERADLVRQLVTSLKETVRLSFPPVVFVVMGADDGTEGWLLNQASTGLPIEVIRLNEVLPFAKAVNLAVSHVNADWLLLLNNDVVILPGYWAALDEMVNLGYEVIGSKLLYPLDYKAPASAPAIAEGIHRLQHAGKMFTLDWRPFHILRYQPEDHPQAQQIRPFPNVTFAAVAIKREVWAGVGGLDESYQNGYEDDDFCLAAREGGAQIGVHPQMRAIHLEAQSTGLDTANKQAQFEKFHKKWIESGRIMWPLGVFQGWS